MQVSTLRNAVSSVGSAAVRQNYAFWIGAVRLGGRSVQLFCLVRSLKITVGDKVRISIGLQLLLAFLSMQLNGDNIHCIA
jgi:hypothetical protein